jgi:hypothetical protein
MRDLLFAFCLSLFALRLYVVILSPPQRTKDLSCSLLVFLLCAFVRPFVFYVVIPSAERDLCCFYFSPSNSSFDMSLMCVAIHQLYPKGSFTPDMRDP